MVRPQRLCASPIFDLFIIAASVVAIYVSESVPATLLPSQRALQVYDYFLTFNEEISLVWFSKWSVVKVAFLVNRYLVIPGIILQEFGVC